MPALDMTHVKQRKLDGDWGMIGVAYVDGIIEKIEMASMVEKSLVNERHVYIAGERYTLLDNPAIAVGKTMKGFLVSYAASGDGCDQFYVTDYYPS